MPKGQKFKGSADILVTTTALLLIEALLFTAFGGVYHCWYVTRVHRLAEVIGPKATKLSKITRDHSHYAVQGHSTFNVTTFGTSRKSVCDFLSVNK